MKSESEETLSHAKIFTTNFVSLNETSDNLS